MNNKTILLTSAILGLGITGYICYGFTPLRTYYPNGQIQSESPRKFYQKEGVSREYYENGQLKMETPFTKNVKNGVQINYFKEGIRLETPYQNGKKEGLSKLYYSPEEIFSFPFQDNKLIGEIKLNNTVIATIDLDRQFSIQNQVKGKLVCDDLEFIQNITVLDKNKRLMGVAKCIAIENFEYKNIGNPPLSIQFDGAFQYPSFTKTTTIHIVDENHTLEKSNPLENEKMATLPPYLSDLKAYSQYYFLQNATVTIDGNNKDIYFKGFNKNKNKLVEIDYTTSNISSIVEDLYTYAQTEKEEVLLNILKKININKYLLLTPQGKKNAELVGKLGFDVGLIENGTHFDLFSAQEKSVLKLTKIDKGISLKISYPNGDKDLFTADVKIDCPGLEELMKKISEAPSLNEEELNKIKNSINPFALIPNSISIQNLKLKNYEGEDVLSVHNFVIEPLTQSVTGTIELSKNAKPYRTYHFKGDSETVEMIANGETQEISIEQVPDTIAQDWIDEQRTKIADPWIKEAQTQIAHENKTSLTFAYLGGIEGYTQATNRYDMNTIIDTTNKYVSLIEQSYTAYAQANNSVQDFQIPPFNQTGLNPSTDKLGIQIEASKISKEGIEVTITFSKDKERLCQLTAYTIDALCKDTQIIYTYPSEAVQKIIEQYEKPLQPAASQTETVTPVSEEEPSSQVTKISQEAPSSTEENIQTQSEETNSQDTKALSLKPEENKMIPLIEAAEIKTPVVPQIPSPKNSSTYSSLNTKKQI